MHIIKAFQSPVAESGSESSRLKFALQQWAIVIGAAVIGVIVVAPFASAQTDTTDLRGDWLGSLQVGNTELRLVVTLEKTADSYTGFMDSVDQGVAGIALDAVSVNDSAVSFEIEEISARFDGQYDADSDEIRGQWKQGSVTLPLTLKRTQDPPSINRPQEPQGPIPYGSFDVEYDNPEFPGVRLAGTLTIPQGRAPFPAALLVSGSGPQDRDETIMGHKPFWVLADHLTRNGIAVLRVDDRGVGASTGTVNDATTETFASDARSGVRYLMARDEVDDTRVGLIGHSEGGLIAPIVATEIEEVAYVVLLAAPAIPGDSLILHQAELVARAQGIADDVVDRVLDIATRAYDIVTAAPDSATAQRRLRDYYQNLSPDDRRLMGVTQANLDAVVNRLASPWFRSFLDYEPRPTLQSLTSPVLALYGENDLQVSPDQNVDEMRTALTLAPTMDFSVQILPGLNHLFQTSATGAPTEYGKIEETFSPVALEIITDWITTRFGNAN